MYNMLMHDGLGLVGSFSLCGVFKCFALPGSDQERKAKLRPTRMEHGFDFEWIDPVL